MGTAFEQAQHLEQAGQIEAAREVLQLYVREYPDDARGWHMLARLADNLETRIDCWEQVARLSPERKTPKLFLGNLRILAERKRRLTSK